MIFRMSRTSIKLKLDENFKDFRFYKKKGWFNAYFYYAVKLSPVRKFMRCIFDYIALKVNKE
ncbi:MAG: hypothetical protein JXP36_10330 [Bacteroidales bacterium]|nr:hypothetical protein [Bacteroidales bacterium]